MREKEGERGGSGETPEDPAGQGQELGLPPQSPESCYGERPSWRTDRREDGEGSEGPLVDRGAVQVATATRGAQAFLTTGTPRTKSHRPSPSSRGTLRSEEIKRRFAGSFRRFRNRDGCLRF